MTGMVNLGGGFESFAGGTPSTLYLPPRSKHVLGTVIHGLGCF